MKKSLLLCCIMAAFVFAGCAKAPASISVSPSSKELTEGETADFTATVLPENAKYSAITWTSSDKAVAMVEGGHVMAVGAGKATITASTEGVSGTAQVTVKAKVIPVGGITLDKTNLELTEEDEATLVATVTPDNATDKNVTWSSSDQTVASVDQTGKVKALKPGTATVTAKAGDAEAKCQVTVKQKIIPVTSISMDITSKTIDIGETVQINAQALPDNATDKTITWSTSDANIASVDKTGLVKGIAPGTAIITAKSGDVKATCEIKVNKPDVTGIRIDNPVSELPVGGTLQLKYTISPQNAAAYAELSFRSTAENVASVSQTGLVTALKEGDTQIVVQAESGVYAVMNLKVFTPVESFIEYDHLYKVKPGTTEVSLEANYDGYQYGGSVIISSTVVHNGVTYSVTEINNLYNYLKASTITFEEGIQRINNNSLNGLNAEYLHLPASLVFFPTNAEGLRQSPNMLAVYVSSDNPYYYTYDRCLYRRDSLIAVPQGIEGSVTVKDGTKTIPRWVFRESKCRVVNIPASVRFVGNSFMNYCKNIADIYVHWSAEELNSIVFEQSQFPYNVKEYFFNGLIYSNITIHVPQGTVDKYKAHQVWGLIPNITDN